MGDIDTTCLEQGTHVLVDQRQEQAADMAEAAARRVRDKLREIGAPAEVTWWVQPWRVEKSEVFEDAQVVER